MTTPFTPKLRPDVMRPGEFRQRLGLSWSRFCELQACGRFRHLEARQVSASLGTRVYSRKKVMAFVEDASVAVADKGPQRRRA